MSFNYRLLNKALNIVGKLSLCASEYFSPRLLSVLTTLFLLQNINISTSPKMENS